MAHTLNQDLQSCLNTLSFDFSVTQKEVKKINANITIINVNMHVAIDAKMENLKKGLFTQLASQLESFNFQLFAKMNIPWDHISSDQPFHLEGDTSSNFHSHQFQHDLHLPSVCMNKFDSSYPTGWVTQMEHYFSLNGITDELEKLHYDVLHLDPKWWQWWKWCKKERQGYVSWTQFVSDLYDLFDTDTHHLGHLTKLKQTSLVEEFIASFEQLDFRTESMTCDFFRECFISGHKDEIHAHVLMALP